VSELLTIKDYVRRFVLLKLTTGTYRHEASHFFVTVTLVTYHCFVTAELLVALY